MCQYQVENEYYSVMHFDHILVFETELPLGAEVKYAEATIDAFRQHICDPPLTEVQRFQCGDVIKIRDGLTFVVHLGLPHMLKNLDSANISMSLCEV